ncbi:hypothetical protein CFBP8129_18660 [Xanthomonas hortorum pv. gardneri]|uniref:Uncharacterized protein n=1 Tax=Xanthomonas hortorum pv. gardneri TaxID=2754056 RepID=A0A6V7CZ67_9XANT|nr:hypothetical protein CFBP8129_18660 [Xanthomonas hortorum pv. gardneri]CAD0325405.1 hypothetical protein CFBP8129_18660 [Xanthomonas hortorum pv. gardneri]
MTAAIERVRPLLSLMVAILWVVSLTVTPVPKSLANRKTCTTAN